MDSWAEWLAPGLGRALPPGTPLRKDLVGGVDGVTGANQFEARIVPDGGTALLLPGSAAMAWLVGDPRARFDVGQWVPALAGVTPGLVMSRLPLPAHGGAPLRVAASGPTGPELPALLALDLLGAAWVPVFGLTDACGDDALAAGQVDAVCLHGRRVAELAQTMAAAGAAPAVLLRQRRRGGAAPARPGLPGDAGRQRVAGGAAGDAPLRTAWRATAAASELEVALVLPQLTPAAMVALWRRACAQAIGSERGAGAGERGRGAAAAARRRRPPAPWPCWPTRRRSWSCATGWRPG